MYEGDCNSLLCIRIYTLDSPGLHSLTKLTFSKDLNWVLRALLFFLSVMDRPPPQQNDNR